MQFKKMIFLLLVICMVIPISINNLSVYAIDSIPGDYSIRWQFEESHLDETGHLLESHIFSEGGYFQYASGNPKEGNFSAFFDGKTMIYSEDLHTDGKYILTRLGDNSQMTVSTLVKATESKNQGIWEFLLSPYHGDLFVRYTDTNRVIMGFNGVEIVSDQIVPLNEWHLITYVWDGTEMRLYINGSLSASQTHPDAGTIDFNNGHWFSDWYIGSGWGSNTPPAYFNGYMDDLIVYGRALTPMEIQDMYHFYFGPSIPQYNVSFNVDGGTPVPTQTVDYNQKATRPDPDPTKAGHNFGGWYTDSSFTTEFDFENTPITQDTDVYGKWDIIQYTVEFDSQGGSPVASETVDYNSLLPTPTAPTKTGYNFGGWYKDAGLMNHWNFATDVITGDITTLYARWNIEQYSVTFNVDGGTPVPTQTVDYNQKAIRPDPDPTKAGHNFGGWYTDSSFTTEFDFENTPITQDTTVYGKWDIIQYTVEFDSQGGSPVASETVDYNSLLPTPTAPTKTGYNFGGWYKDPGLMNHWNFATDVITGDITTLYARWNIEQYSVTFNVDGGTPVPTQTVDYNQKAIRPDPDPTKAGHNFGGWYTDSSFTTEFDFENTPITQDTTVYGKWDIIQYTVEFDSQGGSPVASETVDYNSLLPTPTAPTKTGYNFGGWYKDPGLMNHWNFATDVITGDITTLYARWNIEQYSVTFNVDGGTPVPTQTVDYNQKAIRPDPDPTKAGHNFGGWYTDSSFTTEFDFENTPITQDTTVYGKWDIIQYTVEFDSQGGSPVASETVDYNSLLPTPTAPTKTGYNFGGWYKDSGLMNHWSFAADVITGDITLYARWNIEQYSVTFNVDGGTTVPTQFIYYNQKATRPVPDPTKTGHNFGGWYTDSSFTTEFDFENTPITQDTTVYGKWDIIQYTVEFDSQGGSLVASETVDYNSLLPTPTAPTKTGYNFGGWYKDAGLINQWNFGVDIVTENRTLYAKWLTPQDSITMIASPNNVEFTEDFNQIFTLNISNDTVIGSVYKSDINLGGVFSNLNIGQVNNSETAVTAEVYGNLSSAGVGTITLNEDKLNNRTNPLSVNITVASKPTYTVYFNVNGGSSVGNQTVEYNQKATRPLDPTKAGYTFDGWYTDNSFTTEFNFEKTITTDMHIYARWVSYNANLSSLILSQGTLLPEFYHGITSYVANVANNVTNIKITPIVADAGATVIVNGDAVESGQPSQAINLNVGENTVTVEVTAQDGSIKTYTVIINRAEPVAPPRNSSGGGGGGRSTPLSNNQDQAQKLATEAITEIDGKREMKLVVDSQQINNLIEEYAKEHQTNKEVSFSITTPGDITRVLLTGDIVKNLEDNDFRVSIIEEQVQYHLDAQNFTIEKVAELMGVPSDSLHTIDIELNIDKTSSIESEMLKEQAKAFGHEIVVEPVKFEIIARTSTDYGAVKEVKINRFNTYSKRIIEIPNGVDKNKITTGIVSNANGSYSHIPTEIFQKDGKTYSRLNSLTNSSYSIIWSPVFIDEVKGHWSEAIVNDMASRLVLVDYQNFKADKAVTRAEFADYIVRALGLYREGLTLENKFTDLDKNKHLTSVLIANDWGIINGYPDGTFKPGATITREEAMTMYAKAMDIVKILENSEDKLSLIVDSNEVSDWATAYVSRTVDAGIFSGKGNGILDPKGTLTHAESLAAIRSLLIKAELINN